MRRAEEEFGIRRCKLLRGERVSRRLHAESVDSKVLPQSAGNCMQCPVINRTETEMKRRRGVPEPLQGIAGQRTLSVSCAVGKPEKRLALGSTSTEALNAGVG